MTEPQPLQPTPASQWRKTKIVQLPSGNAVEIRENLDLLGLMMADEGGNVPDIITQQLIDSQIQPKKGRGSQSRGKANGGKGKNGDTSPTFKPEDAPAATRGLSGKCLGLLSKTLTGIIGGSADLAGSNQAVVPGGGKRGWYLVGRD